MADSSMTETSLDERQGFALDLVLRAGRLALAMRRDLGPAEAKSPIDVCTEADRAVIDRYRVA